MSLLTEIAEAHVHGGGSFSMPSFQSQCAESGAFEPWKGALEQLRAELQTYEFNKVLRGALRFAFFIQLVALPEVNTTHYRVRWTTELEQGDPRFATQGQADDVFDRAVQLLIATPLEHLQSYAVSTGNRPWAPFDYTTADEVALHRAENTELLGPDYWRRPWALWNAIRTSEDDVPLRMAARLAMKVRVKSYKTDRSMVGVARTNREWRWETNPSSIHYALLKHSMSVEHKLLQQVINFHGAPTGLRERAYEEGLVSPEHYPTRCPITLEELTWEELGESLTESTHGKSPVHVGHLDPLKGEKRQPGWIGHAADNVSWISDTGNRLQGTLSVQEVREMIVSIAERYKSSGYI